VKELSKDHPAGRTKEDIFEQIIDFTLSEQYVGVKSLVYFLGEKAMPESMTKL